MRRRMANSTSSRQRRGRQIRPGLHRQKLPARRAHQHGRERDHLAQRLVRVPFVLQELQLRTRHLGLSQRKSTWGGGPWEARNFQRHLRSAHLRCRSPLPKGEAASGFYLPICRSAVVLPLGQPSWHLWRWIGSSRVRQPRNLCELCRYFCPVINQWSIDQKLRSKYTFRAEQRL